MDRSNLPAALVAMRKIMEDVQGFLNQEEASPEGAGDMPESEEPSKRLITLGGTSHDIPKKAPQLLTLRHAPVPQTFYVLGDELVGPSGGNARDSGSGRPPSRFDPYSSGELEEDDDFEIYPGLYRGSGDGRDVN